MQVDKVIVVDLFADRQDSAVAMHELLEIRIGIGLVLLDILFKLCQRLAEVSLFEKEFGEVVASAGMVRGCLEEEPEMLAKVMETLAVQKGYRIEDLAKDLSLRPTNLGPFVRIWTQARRPAVTS